MEWDIVQYGNEVQVEHSILTLEEEHVHMVVASTLNHYHQGTTQAIQTNVGHYIHDPKVELDRMR